MITNNPSFNKFFRVINSFGITTLLLSLPKSIYISFRFCGVKRGISFPIFVHWNTKLRLHSKSRILIKNNGRILVGFNKTILTNSSLNPCLLELHSGSVLHIKGRATLGPGVKLSIHDDAEITIGDKFWITGNTILISDQEIFFGDGTVISWNVYISTTDFHSIYTDDNIINKSKRIRIGDNVWIGKNSTVLKGANIGSMSVIGLNSIVAGKVEKNTLSVGAPCRVIKKNISWSIETP